MLLLHIFPAFSHISVCVFVVFFPCLFSVKNLLNLFIDDYYNIQRYKLYGNMSNGGGGSGCSGKRTGIFVPLPRIFGNVYLRNICRKIP